MTVAAAPITVSIQDPFPSFPSAQGVGAAEPATLFLCYNVTLPPPVPSPWNPLAETRARD